MGRQQTELRANRRGFGALAILLMIGLAGCSTEAAKEQLSADFMPPVLNPVTEMNQSLRDLPPPEQPVVVAVYNYTDQTGQFKPLETTQTLSKAVTQGATSILIKALQDVSYGRWFTVVERERIDNLLKERAIVTQMRATYLGEKTINAKTLPPLLYAGIIFEGGIIGFDTNTQTGGVGARLLGIGADVKYQLNTITIYLRAVSTKSGQVLASVTTHKTIASIGIQGGAFKYIAFDKLLEVEAGITKNEPDQIAVQQAIEKAVYTMIIEGAAKNVWSFADKNMQSRLIRSYRLGESLKDEPESVGSIGPVSAAAPPAVDGGRGVPPAASQTAASKARQPSAWRANLDGAPAPADVTEVTKYEASNLHGSWVAETATPGAKDASVLLDAR
jgi:curli production assembly/transport component CsgG